MDYNLPSIILQPIVENAIEHGIRMKEPGKQGELTLSGHMDGHDIVFEITDNGPGLTQGQIAEILSKSGRGYGVKNVNDRLRLFFDDGYGLRFQPNPAGGARVVIRIPQYLELSAED